MLSTVLRFHHVIACVCHCVEQRAAWHLLVQRHIISAVMHKVAFISTLARSASDVFIAAVCLQLTICETFWELWCTNAVIGRKTTCSWLPCCSRTARRSLWGQFSVQYGRYFGHVIRPAGPHDSDTFLGQVSISRVQWNEITLLSSWPKSSSRFVITFNVVSVVISNHFQCCLSCDL